MLTDTAPLVALVDKRDAHYTACSNFFKRLRAPMVTTWPCLTEAIYLLRSVGGWPYVLDLWGFYEKGFLRLHRSGETELQRVREIMTTYRDIPCDFADASLVAAAETLGAKEVFTRDSHFYAYIKPDGSAFEVKP